MVVRLLAVFEIGTEQSLQHLTLEMECVHEGSVFDTEKWKDQLKEVTAVVFISFRPKSHGECSSLYLFIHSFIYLFFHLLRAMSLCYAVSLP